jgi:hypothetical protein
MHVRSPEKLIAPMLSAAEIDAVREEGLEQDVSIWSYSLCILLGVGMFLTFFSARTNRSWTDWYQYIPSSEFAYLKICHPAFEQNSGFYVSFTL